MIINHFVVKSDGNGIVQVSEQIAFSSGVTVTVKQLSKALQKIHQRSLTGS